MTLMSLSSRWHLRARLALLAWVVLILFLSSRSSLPGPGDSSGMRWLGRHQDEVGHLGEYAILAMLAYASLPSSLGRRRASALALGFCLSFSLADEAFQGLIPNRTPQITDVLLDGVGAVVALGFLVTIGPRLKGHLLNYWRGFGLRRRL